MGKRSDQRFLKCISKREGKVSAERMERIGRLNELAKKRGQTMAEMAVAWLLKEEAITSVLVGASRPSQIIDNIKAIDNTEFSEEELREIDAESIF